MPVGAPLILSMFLFAAAAPASREAAPVELPSLPFVREHNHGCDYKFVPFTDPSGRTNREIRSYRDPLSGYFLRVAPDGRHLEAVNAKGRLVWFRDPHEGIEPYRYDPACIHSIGPDSYGMGAISNAPITFYVRDNKTRTIQEGRTGQYIDLIFDNSQRGLLDVWTGDFIFLGQN